MQKTTKPLLFAVYILVIVCMGAATIVEKYKGSDFVASYIYGSWWFVLLWAVLAALSIVYFVRHITKAWTGIALHLSFVIILAGAFVTHVSSERGVIHLRKGVFTSQYTTMDNNNQCREAKLPFEIRLDSFDVKYHAGTDAAQDYVSVFTISKDGKTVEGKVSMNNIFSFGSMRLYQASYDNDMLGASLSTNADPIGIPLTYTGYALLFVSLVGMLIDPRGAYRKLLRSNALKRGALLIAVLFAMCTPKLNGAFAADNTADVKAHYLPEATAASFGNLFILYNSRICPMQTFAIDFTKKLYGTNNYKGLTAEQVLTGWMFWGEEWMNEPMIKLKGGEMKETLQLPDYVSANSFFNQEMGGYTIGPYVQEYYNGNHDKFNTQAVDVDDKMQLLMDVQRGVLLKIFPYTLQGKTTWLAPTDALPQSMDRRQQQFVKAVFALLHNEAMTGNYKQMDLIVEKMRKYQMSNAGSSLPTAKQVEAERTYNDIPFATNLFMLCLTMGFVTFMYTLTRLCRRCRTGNCYDTHADILIAWLSRAVMLIALLSLSYCEYLRWTISGTLPMANGYETMLFVAWIVLLVSLALSFKFRILLTCGFLMSGFFLLVSHIAQMDPQITHIMPVLNSPLLSIHVSIIMMGFALLSLTFICGLTAIIVRYLNHNAADIMLALQQLSLLFLYPAMATLGIGIFVGAIWANVSWGEYWGWDPKEVWALITFMVYAAALHPKSLPQLHKPMVYHVFMVVAFCTIIMTYFGVNYFLGGMHSYA